ncbi:hypothetical protein CI102_272 [Trichoderma harzianum]|nr:hypothetical protein CI102_272 [Trichoderma harzianum]
MRWFVQLEEVKQKCREVGSKERVSFMSVCPYLVCQSRGVCCCALARSDNRVRRAAIRCRASLYPHHGTTARPSLPASYMNATNNKFIWPIIHFSMTRNSGACSVIQTCGSAGYLEDVLIISNIGNGVGRPMQTIASLRK